MNWLQVKTETTQELRLKLAEIEARLSGINESIEKMEPGVVKATSRVFFKSLVRFANFVIVRGLKKQKS